jgi:hypothetical protein
MISSFFINEEKYELNVQGEVTCGNNEVLSDKEINLCRNQNWNDKGYIIKKLINEKLQSNLQKEIINFLIKSLKKTFSHLLDVELNIEKYHKYLNYQEHLTFLKLLESGIDFDKINFDKKILENAVSDNLDFRVTTKNKDFLIINEKSFAVRIIRPKQSDFNPPHKDVYLDRLKNGINIYMPIIGSNEKSSLPIMDASHLLNENKIYRTKEGSIVNNVKFRVPCIVKTEIGLFLNRPNPKNDEIMIFSPYLIHGGGLNLNDDTTRISLELRFWKYS